MISFRLRGGVEAATRLLSRLRLVILASSLVDFATLICRPVTMTHYGMPPEAQAAASIAPDLLRLSVGIEDPDDLLQDLNQAMVAA